MAFRDGARAEPDELIEHCRHSLARFKTPQAIADYLKFFRADAIVRDAEAIRHELVGDGEPWTILGQSYGGFCALTYLSMAPHALAGAIITGGLPSVTYRSEAS